MIPSPLAFSFFFVPPLPDSRCCSSLGAALSPAAAAGCSSGNDLQRRKFYDPNDCLNSYKGKPALMLKKPQIRKIYCH